MIPQYLIVEFWYNVRCELCERHKLSEADAGKAIAVYRGALQRHDAEVVCYPRGPEDVACIVAGGWQTGFPDAVVRLGISCTQVSIDTRRISDWETFHDVFAATFGFPGFYGRNLNAWIDCMSYLDDPSASMTTIHVPRETVLVLQLENVGDFALRCPEQYVALVECSAFVNWRRIETGESAVLALSFNKS